MKKMKHDMLYDIGLSIKGREISAILAGDNTKDGGAEAYRASKLFRDLFIGNDQYDTLTFTVTDRADRRRTLWCFKLDLHGKVENYILDLVGGDFLSGLVEG